MPGRFRFGEFELDLDAYVLRLRDERIRLEKIPMELLILLVRNAGTLVPRGKIQSALWGPDVFVERDAAVNTAIGKIRKALGDDADTPRFVETVVGKGYRFIAPVLGTASSPSFPHYLVSRGRREFSLEAGDHILGREPVAAVFVDHPSVSRRHARIRIDADGAVLEDMKSRNGTFLNGRRIDKPARLAHGAVIGLGPVTLTFRVKSAPASTLPLVKGAGST
jgi:DNA-binding winged helix-turn-helix (wHTH) protein